MTILILGTLLFFTFHLIPSFKVLHVPLITQLGEGGFRGLYIAGSVTGMILIIVGKATADYVPLWTPPLEANHAAAIMMLPACILFAAMAIPTNLKRYTRHPMLWGVVFWSVAHCLANGDLASIICFGAFGAFALRSMWSLNHRGAAFSTAKVNVAYDALVIITGVIGYGLLVWLHPYLFGVAPISKVAFFFTAWVTKAVN
ncbi:MAG: NnrU family protein [Gammaproteobacteria bacterium]|nr:NnrU family protein [Gammaproteobacteria bacterium]MCP4088335.1 NnrU family protein [Gammaproteobacteria bacterium]MCP4276354.1 NnrU family protein [Gammaproteobacteria bacterium]MCP4831001.1 NnrU family protein [Gammaproteobacteria bacterium]MCP4927478.1 NnrU family protein [Gammaproteobacteria bacterium]